MHEQEIWQRLHRVLLIVAGCAAAAWGVIVVAGQPSNSPFLQTNLLAFGVYRVLPNVHCILGSK